MDDKKNQAVHDFVDREFKGIPQSMIVAYLEAREEGIENITPLKIGETYKCWQNNEEVEILSYDPSSEMYTALKNDGEEIEIEKGDVETDFYGSDFYGSRLPMWGTMWLIDRNYWINHVQELADSGFIVYDVKEENNLLVGIDGAGYDFYEAHWEPLYDAMGYKWHELENTVSVSKAVQFAASLGAKPEAIAKGLDISKNTVAQYMPHVETR